MDKDSQLRMYVRQPRPSAVSTTSGISDGVRMSAVFLASGGMAVFFVKFPAVGTFRARFGASLLVVVLLAMDSCGRARVPLFLSHDAAVPLLPARPCTRGACVCANCC